ncbi:hypothetical protein FRX31_006771 [Thalictrum thalictroides]|uniref:Uncharacterized protein n=1 Tax=Thalictrum thalictroides TaxID=46969 RepID=A0A7J6X2S7_THATH|nr:hypothetical protein FRX31_006771 [Thalictrum thalictroides]
MVVGCEVDISVMSLCCEDLQSSSPILFFPFFPLPGGIPIYYCFRRFKKLPKSQRALLRFAPYFYNKEVFELSR